MVWEDELVLHRLSRGRLAWPLTVSESYAKASGTLAPPPSIQAPGPDWPARSSVPQQHQQATQQHSCQQVDTIEPRSGPTGRRVKAKPSVGMLARRRVIIIGAGFAGLSAARTIQGSAGDRVEVVVLEASSAVGGRARSAVVSQGMARRHMLCRQRAQPGLLARRWGASETNPPADPGPTPPEAAKVHGRRPH